MAKAANRNTQAKGSHDGHEGGDHGPEAHGGHGHDHGDLFGDLLDHVGPVLDNCPEGVYLWLDEEHTVCNEAMAKMLGVTPEEWSLTYDFLGTFVDAPDRPRFADNYNKAIGHLQGPIRFRFTALR